MPLAITATRRPGGGWHVLAYDTQTGATTEQHSTSDDRIGRALEKLARDVEKAANAS